MCVAFTYLNGGTTTRQRMRSSPGKPHGGADQGVAVLVSATADVHAMNTPTSWLERITPSTYSCQPTHPIHTRSCKGTAATPA